MTGQKYKFVALLPMKAHSERVPGKNFRNLYGRPLYRWILDTLLEVRQIDLIVINTDAIDELSGDPEVTNNPRVLLRERKDELRGDYVSMNRILEDDIAAVESDYYVMTHVTNPLLSARTIDRAVEMFAEACEEEGIDSLFSVNRFQSRFYWKDGRPINHDPDNLLPTQHLDPLYEENSNLYIFTRASFAQTNARIGKKPLMYETPRLESLDIDTMDDWDLVEKVARPE